MHKWIIEIAFCVEPKIRYAAIRNFEDAGFVVVDKRFVGGPQISNPTAPRWRYTIQHHSKHAMMLYQISVSADCAITIIDEFEYDDA
jgi:hypothetical protein|tara:strand:- start:2676 stop:2936 length:261 start_codon:yes stop_codon:yes gene_type:complete